MYEKVVRERMKGKANGAGYETWLNKTVCQDFGGKTSRGVMMLEVH